MGTQLCTDPWWLGRLLVLRAPEPVGGGAPPPMEPPPPADPAGAPDLDPTTEWTPPEDDAAVVPDVDGDEDEDEDTEPGPQASEAERQAHQARRMTRMQRRREATRQLKRWARGRTPDELAALDEAAALGQQLRQLAAAARTDPASRRQFYALMAQHIPFEDARADPRPSTAAETGFDESQIPFRAGDHPVNDYLIKQFRTQHELQQEVLGLRAIVQEMRNAQDGDKQTAVRGQWRNAIDAAAGEIKHGGVQALFKNACAMAYELARTRGQMLSPDQVVRAGLKMLGITGQQHADMTAAARQQRIAEGNRSKPSAAAVGRGGSPAIPRQDRDPNRTIDSILSEARKARQARGEQTRSPFV